MKGGTEFIFVTEGIESALKRAEAAAGRKNVRLGGGVFSVREYLRAGLVDELHLAVRPGPLGRGENMYAGMDLPSAGLYTARSPLPVREPLTFSCEKADLPQRSMGGTGPDGSRISCQIPADSLVVRG